MSRPILLTLIILLGTTLRYHLGISDFWMKQSYLVRELMSSGYKILWMLIPALLIFPEQRRQKIVFSYSKLGITVILALGIGLGGGKLIVSQFFPQLISDTATLPFTLFFILVTNSFCEEYVFRGIVMEQIRSIYNKVESVTDRHERINAQTIPIIMQSLFFALIHLPLFLSFDRPPLLILSSLGMVFMLGLLFGYLRDKTQSLLYPMLVHSVWNRILIFL